MNSDLTSLLMTMQQSRTQQSAQIAVIRKSNEMDMALADMIDDTMKSAPAPAPQGQGRVIDKRA